MAAFIAEPILGASAGAAVPPEDYARKAREICARHGVVYIDDEVMTGFGRTGAFFGIEWSGVSPDLVTCGKGMSGGYMPVGAVLASERIVAALERSGGFTHGFTFSHHPVTAAACLETLRILEDEDLVVARARTLGETSPRPSRALARTSPRRRRARPRPHAGVELVADKATRRPFPRGGEEGRGGRRRGPSRTASWSIPSTGCADGRNGDLVMLAPPFVTTEEQIDEMAALLARTLEALGL